MKCTVTGDISRASAKVQSELPGRGKQAEKEGEKYAAQAGAKVDSAVSSPYYSYYSYYSHSFPKPLAYFSNISSLKWNLGGSYGIVAHEHMLFLPPIAIYYAICQEHKLILLFLGRKRSR